MSIIPTEYSKDRDLINKIADIRIKWMFEFDTDENRFKLDKEISDTISNHISSKRCKKINKILDV
jgi:hypothetical protein